MSRNHNFKNHGEEKQFLSENNLINMKEIKTPHLKSPSHLSKKSKFFQKSSNKKYFYKNKMKNTEINEQNYYINNNEKRALKSKKKSIPKYTFTYYDPISNNRNVIKNSRNGENNSLYSTIILNVSKNSFDENKKYNCSINKTTSSHMNRKTRYNPIKLKIYNYNYGNDDIQDDSNINTTSNINISRNKTFQIVNHSERQKKTKNKIYHPITTTHKEKFRNKDETLNNANKYKYNTKTINNKKKEYNNKIFFSDKSLVSIQNKVAQNYIIKIIIKHQITN